VVASLRGTPHWEISSAPILIIGVADEPASHALHIPASPRLTATAVAVLNAQREIRFFDLAGRYLKTLGREGDGPGEFRGVRAFAILPNGNLVTLDKGDRRVQVLDPEGRQIRTYTLAKAIDVNIPPSFRPDGTIAAFAHSLPWDYSSRRLFRDTVAIMLFDTATGRPATIGRAAGYPWWVTEYGRTGAPLAPRPGLAAGADFVVVSEGVHFELRFLQAPHRVRVIRLDRQPARIDDEIADDWVRDRRAQLNRRGMSPRARVVPEGYEFSTFETVPGYWRLFVDEVGCVWAERYKVAGATRVIWDVYNPLAPSLIATVEADAWLTVSGATGKRVIGITEDEAGVQRIAIHELIRDGQDATCR
jgi:hypothetical protein